ncbi:MAG: cellulase family glycosylhydrolase [Acidobacteria bacterium]|nr:cellulase family glycosylhydrolase [Acidobacteriota bacterium]
MARALLLGALLLVFLGRSSSAQASPDLARNRAHRLERGINLSEWFAQVYDPKGYNKEHFQSWVLPKDIALIKSMGFDHVRLSVNPAPMMRHNLADQLPSEYLGYLDAAIAMILNEQLAVIIDLHPDSDFKARLAEHDDFVEQFADFWRALARHYASWDRERVFFEILNEPEFRDRYRWAGVQAMLASAIRAGAPEHTIIAAGARWSDIEDLVALTPLQDSNVVYNFHFYDPHTFTHQGANWGANYWHFESKLGYPSSLDTAEKVARSEPDPVNRLLVLRYGLDHWDQKRIAVEIGQAAEWARHWQVPLTCNEFGVYRRFSEAGDRARWLRDVRSTLESDRIGWNMWDYSGSFSVVNGTIGQHTPDEVSLQALGLKP